MKNKGFTLIEVLAILIVLSIIAVLGIPKITKSLEKSRKNSAEASALGYVDTIEKQLINNEAISKYTEMKDGIYNVPLDSKYGVKIGGKGPDKGYIEVSEYKVVRYSLTFGKYTITYDGRNRKVEKKEGTNVTVVYSYGNIISVTSITDDLDEIFPDGYMKSVIIGDKIDLEHNKIIHHKLVEKQTVNGEEDVRIVDANEEENLVGIFSTNINDVLSVPSNINDPNSEKIENNTYLRHLLDDDGIVISTETCKVFDYGTLCLGVDESTNKYTLFEKLKTKIFNFNKWDSKNNTSEYDNLVCFDEEKEKDDNGNDSYRTGCAYDYNGDPNANIEKATHINFVNHKNDDTAFIMVSHANIAVHGNQCLTELIEHKGKKLVESACMIMPDDTD